MKYVQSPAMVPIIYMYCMNCIIVLWKLILLVYNYTCVICWVIIMRLGNLPTKLGTLHYDRCT